jgi:diguanylate cyclase (GGDEF)-like protein
LTALEAIGVEADTPGVDGAGRRGWILGALEEPEDRDLAGRLAGLLYLAGSLAVVVMLLLPQVEHDDPAIVIALAAAGALWGIACLTVVPWERAPRWVSHASSSAGFVITAIGVACLGGEASPARFLLLFIAFYAAFFYPPTTTAIYLALCCVVYALPLAYSDGAADLVAELTVMVPVFVLLGGAVALGKRRLLELRSAAERATEGHRELAAEQAALRRLATAVAAEQSADEIYGIVSREAAKLLGADASGVLRIESPDELTVLGAESPAGTPTYRIGQTVPVQRGTDIARLLATGQPVLVRDHEPHSPASRLGYRCTVIAPVYVATRLWGLLAVAALEPHRFGDETVGRLRDFASLLGTSIRNTEDRRLLTEMATSDPLTGLANHRTFHERLKTEVARALRHGRPLSLVLVDLDQFKEINDTAGHGAGDKVLAAVAADLQQVARTEDVLARIGGDEFALLLPETSSMDALAFVERLRSTVSARRVQGYRATLSAGISDITHALNAEQLFRYADGALYWAKAKGRDCAWVYDPQVVRELSAQERAEHLERSQAISALRALARAIDAKDPMTRRHSQRVAALCHQLAEARGWDPDRIQLLTEAALVHDVGKIGVRDAVLLKNGRLTPSEIDEIKQHAVLGAQIVQEVLSDEQVAWIRGHHERPDGTGYPDALSGSKIPEGAALLALADAFDVMTLSRPYSAPRTVEEALAECRELVGRQFSEQAVAALETLAANGALESAGDPQALRSRTAGLT